MKALALFCAYALALASVAHAAEKLPGFVNKVQLWSCGGAEPTADGTGVMVYRAPKEVRDQLDTKTPDGKERSGATQMRAAPHSEIIPPHSPTPVRVLSVSGAAGAKAIS
jgi:hypothetical protein